MVGGAEDGKDRGDDQGGVEEIHEFSQNLLLSNSVIQIGSINQFRDQLGNPYATRLQKDIIYGEIKHIIKTRWINFMKILVRTLKAMAELPPSDIMVIHDLVMTMRKKYTIRPNAAKTTDAYKRARIALQGCEGNLSDDIGRDRDGRV